MKDGWVKLMLGICFGALIIGIIIGLSYLILFVFTLTFNWFADMMIIKGADPSWAAIIALILAVYVFIGVSRNNTINNYIQNKREKKNGEKR